MKRSDIIRKTVAGLLIVAVAVCAFGCSGKKSKKDKKDDDQKKATASISINDMKDAFRDAADKNGLEEIDWDKRYDDGAKTFGISSIGSNGDDAEDIFYSNVGLVLDIPRDADLPEIKDILVFSLVDDNERIYGHYIVFENEKDCEEYRDMFFDWFGDEIGEENGYECFSCHSERRVDALYRDGDTLIWLYEYYYDNPPEMLPSIFDELGLTFPEKPEETD